MAATTSCSMARWQVSSKNTSPTVPVKPLHTARHIPATTLRLLPHQHLNTRSVRASAATAERQASKKQPWWTKNSASNMVECDNIQDFIDVLASNTERLVVVDFFASWCGACKAVYPKLVQLCEQNPDVVLVKVNFDENRQLCKQLGVKVLPFFHFYRGAEGRVDEFSAGVSKVPKLREAIALHNTPRCSLGGSPVLGEFPTLTPHVRTLEEFRQLPAAEQQQQLIPGLDTEKDPYAAAESAV